VDDWWNAALAQSTWTRQRGITQLRITGSCSGLALSALGQRHAGALYRADLVVDGWKCMWQMKIDPVLM